MSRELRIVPEGIVETKTNIGFFKTKVTEIYYKPIPKMYYSRGAGGSNIIWVNNSTGEEVSVDNSLYVKLSNLWALNGHAINLGKKV